MNGTLQRAAPPAAILGLALARLAFGDPAALVPEHAERAPPRADAGPPVSAAASRVLGGLAVGDHVAGFTVERIGGPANGEIVVELREGERGARVWIRRRGARGGAARQTSRFDLFHGPPPPGLEPSPDARRLEVVRALAASVEAGGAEPPGEL